MDLRSKIIFFRNTDTDRKIGQEILDPINWLSQKLTGKNKYSIDTKWITSITKYLDFDAYCQSRVYSKDLM